MVWSGRLLREAADRLVSILLGAYDVNRLSDSFENAVVCFLSYQADINQDDDVRLCRKILAANRETLAPLITVFTMSNDVAEIRKFALQLFGLEEKPE